MEWIDRLDERKEELRRWKSAEMREKMMENAEERREWHENFAKGKTKGLVTKILSKAGSDSR